MKIIKVSGGLGNQMFQYAFYKAMENSGHTQVQLDLSAYSQKKEQDGIDLVHNGFELDSLFNISYNKADFKNVKKLSTQPTNLVTRALRKYFTKKTHFIDKHFNFQPHILNPASKALTENCYLEGNWQTEKYFNNIQTQIRKDFSFKKQLSEKNLFDLTNSASIHIRRGDYLNTKTMNVCSKSYYLNAIQYLFEKKTPKSLLVFSDDLSWCKSDLELDKFIKEKYNSDCKVIYVDWNTGINSWQDMALMSKCNSHIIANSSFSWWGAWLDPNPEKLVIAPKFWNLTEINYKDNYYQNNYNDIVPENWIRVEI